MIIKNKKRKKNKKLKIILLFGGLSAEHEVSINSARNVYNALLKNSYEIVPIYINKQGDWCYPEISKKLLVKTIKLKSNLKGHHVAEIFADKKLSLKNSDLVFPVLHGPNGEDGSIQGLMKVFGLPCVGAGVLGSAIGMDKDVMKRLLKEAGIKTAKFITIRSTDNIPTFESVKKTLKSPFFVKPANLGSSIGISKVKSKAGYKIALRKAFFYDNKIIIEENIKGREIECAVLGNNKDNIIASVPGEIINSKHTFYDYQAKYKDNEGVLLKIPAKLTSAQQKAVKKISIQAYTVLECTGFARVDIFLRNNEIIINEINTIPGFTNYSMYPKMFEASGITQEELVAKLVNLALETK